MIDILVCIVTFIGAECAYNAPTIGTDCFDLDGAIICLVEPEEIPLYASWYDWKLGGINCGGSCDWKASRPVDDSHYGHTAACPHDWLFMTFETPTLADHPSWYCDDRGPAIKLGYRPVWDAQNGTHHIWAWTIDFALDSNLVRPGWVYTVIHDWEFVD